MRLSPGSAPPKGRLPARSLRHAGFPPSRFAESHGIGERQLALQLLRNRPHVDRRTHHMRVRMAISSVRVTWLLRTSNSPPKLGMFCGIGMPFLEVVRLSLIRPPSATVCHGDRGVEVPLRDGGRVQRRGRGRGNAADLLAHVEGHDTARVYPRKKLSRISAFMVSNSSSLLYFCCTCMQSS